MGIRGLLTERGKYTAPILTVPLLRQVYADNIKSNAVEVSQKRCCFCSVVFILDLQENNVDENFFSSASKITYKLHV